MYIHSGLTPGRMTHRSTPCGCSIAISSSGVDMHVNEHGCTSLGSLESEVLSLELGEAGQMAIECPFR